MKLIRFAAFLGLIPVLAAQTNGVFNGPPILTEGIGSVGERSGRDLDLRFYANVTGVYDTGLVPYSVDSNGHLVDPGAQYGLEAGLGGYGRHSFHHSVFGLDYTGNYRHYATSSSYDGTNQALNLEYTVQTSRHVLFDFRGSASTQTFGTVFNNSTAIDSSPSAAIFDTRTTNLSGEMNMHYALSNRTAFTMGGQAYTVHRQGIGLVSADGYMLTGAIQHQIGRDTTVSGTYEHSHYDFRHAFGNTDSDLFSGQITRQFLRSWSISIGGGVYRTENESLQTITLDPVLRALLGVDQVQFPTYSANTFPSVNASLSKKYRYSTFTAIYKRSISAGNGLYLTSRQEDFQGSYGYTGVRRLSLWLTAGTSSLRTVGQSLANYRLITGSALMTYRLGAGLNLTAGYYRRYEDIALDVFQRNSSRVSVGVYFSPGEIPISFH